MKRIITLLLISIILVILSACEVSDVDDFVNKITRTDNGDVCTYDFNCRPYLDDFVKSDEHKQVDSDYSERQAASDYAKRLITESQPTPVPVISPIKPGSVDFCIPAPRWEMSCTWQGCTYNFWWEGC